MKYISYNKFIRNTVITSTIIISIIFAIYGIFIQSHSIEKSIKNDSKVMSELIFQNLYTVMRDGGTKKDLEEIIERSEKNLPNIHINIVKTPDYQDKYIQEVFKTKEPEVFHHIDHIDFASPVIYKDECITCHTNAKSGDLAAVMHIEYPISQLKVSIKEITILIASLFLISIVVIFAIWYKYLNRYFVKPIKDLITQMNQITTHKDLKNSITINTIIQEVKEIEDVFNKQNTRLFDAYDELETMSNIDILTKIYNRKKFDEYSNMILLSAKRYNFPISFVLIDLNKFKTINDTYGHDVGDDILILFTKIVKNSIRESDYLFRLGGDEFVLILAHTTQKDTHFILDKIKENCKANKYTRDDIEIVTDASFGVAQFPLDGDDIDTLLKVADIKMYEDKNKSR